jgi:hypothetical protein
MTENGFCRRISAAPLYPLKYTDPDGKENKAALAFMKDHIVGRNSGYGYAPSIFGGSWFPFKYGAENLPDSLLCYEAVWASYKNSGARTMPASRVPAFDWFKSGGTLNINGKEISKSLVTDISKGEIGDVVFMGEHQEMLGHSVLLERLEVVNANTIKMETVGAFSPNGKVGPETHVFKKNNNDEWINTTHGGNYKFRGYGQFSE